MAVVTPYKVILYRGDGKPEVGKFETDKEAQRHYNMWLKIKSDYPNVTRVERRDADNNITEGTGAALAIDIAALGVLGIFVKV